LRLVSFGDELTLNKDCHVDELARNLNMDSLNLGNNDTSNELIFTDVTKFVCQNDMEDFFVLIGWTSPYRRDLFWKDTVFTYRPDVREYIDNGVNVMHKCDVALFDDHLISQQWVTYALSLQLMLKAQGIKYYMYNTQSAMLYNQSNMKKIQKIDPTHYHNPLNQKSSMAYYLKEKNLAVASIEGAKKWAEFLMAKIYAGGVL
jgi:hypothetical protein